MKVKKINTVPNGRIVIIIFILECFLPLFIGLILLPRIESFGLFAFSLVFLWGAMDCISKKHWNFIFVSEDYIYHGDEKYKWEDVFITGMTSSPNFMRRFYTYYVYFDDHYLTMKECRSKATQKKGFYIMLNPKRIELLLRFYQKEIKMLDEIPFSPNNKTMNAIKIHNFKIKNQ